METAEQTAAPAAAPTPSLAEFRAQKAASRQGTAPAAQAAPKSEPAPQVEPAPESDPVDPQREPANDEDLSNEKAATRKRLSRLLNDRAQARAERDLAKQELARMQAEIESLKNKKPESAPARTEGKPKFEDFLNSGKYKTYEEANEAFLDARDDWNRKEWERSNAENAHKTESEKFRESFREKTAAFEKSHDDFSDVMDALQSEMERCGLENTEFSDALVRLPNAPEVIYHLGGDLDAVEAIAKMPPSLRLVELGRIVSGLSKPSSQAPAQSKTTEERVPKTPITVKGRTETPSFAQATAGSKNFAEFKANKRAARTAGVKL